MSGEVTHFIAYWQDPDNRRKILKKRRQRYRNDPEYAEKQRERARARYEKKGQAPRGRNKPKIVDVDGELVILAGLGEAADMLGVSKKTIRNYEAHGVIPTNVVIDSLGRRWYPRKFLEFLAPFFSNQREKREPLWRLKQRVEEAWQEEANCGNIPLLEKQT